MTWNTKQQATLDRFLQEIKTIPWLKNTGTPSEKYWVVDTVWEACDTHGQQTMEVWGRNSAALEQKALQQMDEARLDAIFEAVALAIGNEVYDAVCDMEDRIGEETGEDQSGIEEEILDFIKRDTAWACVERLIGAPGFFTRVHDINRTGRWACSWVGKYPAGGFIIM